VVTGKSHDLTICDAARMDLRLRPLRPGDELQARAAHEELAADGFSFLLFWQPGQSWSAYLEQCERYRRGDDLPDGFVPATFLVADIDGVIVGRTSIRHELNEGLARVGGHIGYGVRPGHRRRGYASEILRQSLVIVRSLGVERAIVSCDDRNVGSRTIIERGGGVLDGVVLEGGASMRRYRIG
jgi:predicted acetyltransferase